MRLDSNGYGPSLFNTEFGTCYVCGFQGETARHEVFFGTKHRDQAKAFGAWVNLCPGCHQLQAWSVHEDPGGWLDQKLKLEAQRLWIKSHGKDHYWKHIGKNYDEDESI